MHRIACLSLYGQRPAWAVLAPNWDHSLTLYGVIRNAQIICAQRHACKVLEMRVPTPCRPMPGLWCLPTHAYVPCAHSENTYIAIETNSSNSRAHVVHCPGPRPLLGPELTVYHTRAVSGFSLRSNTHDQRQTDVADTRVLTAIWQPTWLHQLRQSAGIKHTSSTRHHPQSKVSC